MLPIHNIKDINNSGNTSDNEEIVGSSNSSYRMVVTAVSNTSNSDATAVTMDHMANMLATTSAASEMLSRDSVRSNSRETKTKVQAAIDHYHSLTSLQKLNRAVIIPLLRECVDLYEHLERELQEDCAVAKVLLEQNLRKWKHLSANLQHDKALAIYVISQDANMYQDLPESLQKDPEIKQIYAAKRS